jgi:hypothetical protein
MRLGAWECGGHRRGFIAMAFMGFGREAEQDEHECE